MARKRAAGAFELLWLLGTLSAAIALLGYQIFQWLKFGVWPPLDLRMVFGDPAPGGDWVGLKRVLVVLGEMPLWVVAVLLSVPATVRPSR